MSINDRVNPGNLSESEIDKIVIAQAEDESAWDDPIEVRTKSPTTTVSLPAELTARAAFLAFIENQP